MHEIIRVFHVNEKVVATQHRAIATYGLAPDGTMSDVSKALGAAAYTEENCPKPEPNDKLNGWITCGYYLDLDGTKAPGADWFCLDIEDCLGQDHKIDDTLIVANPNDPRDVRRLVAPEE